MEIERKFLVKNIPFSLKDYESKFIEQAYLCTEPVVRIRREDKNYYLTYKGKGFMIREEYNLPLTNEAYEHLLLKTDGNIITKRRYFIPIHDNLTIELDIFNKPFDSLILAEVEFPSKEQAKAFLPPDWFDEDVTFSKEYQNNTLSQKSFSNK